MNSKSSGSGKIKTRWSSLQIVTVVIIPVLIFLGGMFTQHWLANRTLALQEFTTATGLLKNEDEVVRSWARKVVDQYAQALKNAGLVSALALAGLPKELQERICFKPDDYFLQAPERTVPELEVGQNVKILFLRSEFDYRSLRIKYDGIVEGLKSSCGFLLPNWKAPIPQKKE